MKVRVIAGLVALKMVVLAAWLITSMVPLGSGLVSAKVPSPDESARAEERQGSGGTLPGKGLMEAIRRKEEELEAREEALDERRRQLAGVRKDLDARTVRLQELMKELRAVREEIDKFNDNKAHRLVKIYESMTPQDAAARLERLDDRTAASILGSMREKIAGKILGFVNVDKSVRISRVLKREIR